MIFIKAVRFNLFFFCDLKWIFFCDLKWNGQGVYVILWLRIFNFRCFRHFVDHRMKECFVSFVVSILLLTLLCGAYFIDLK